MNTLTKRLTLFLFITAQLLCIMHASAALINSQAQTSAPNDEAAVRDVVKHLFETMQAKQTNAMRELFVPEGRLVSTFVRQGQPTVRWLSLDDFAKLVAETKEPYRERMFKEEVRVQGDVATVWGRYDFHVGERLTNCGVNSFQLLRTPQGWKIVHIASTIITQGCQETK
ncbi:MAG: nuclear transport factor 2 family protein [Pyrinomonadaceae bacterium]